MPIDINGLPNAQTQVNGEQNNLPGAGAEPVGHNQDNGKSSVQDTVSFSRTAVRMGKLGAVMNDTPVVDTQRVEQVRKALMNGSHEIDPLRIANKLLQFDELLGSGRQ